MGWFRQSLPRATFPGRKEQARRRTILKLEALEERLVLSWRGTPPSTVTLPSNATQVALNAQADAQANAAISANEVDYYSFVASRTGSYKLTAQTPSSNLDPVLGVFNSSGSRLASNDDISSSNTDSQLTIALTGGTRYYFGITNYTGTAGGSYTWVVDGPGGDDAYEDNDTLAQAANLGTLTASRTIANLVVADNADWFRFAMNGPGASSNSVSITFQNAQGNLDLRLYRSDGARLATSATTNNSEQISLNGLAAGTYYVQVFGQQNSLNPNYTLDIKPGALAASGNEVLYLSFDGVNISRTDLVRWAGNDWNGTVDEFDADRNGISVQRFLSSRGDREQIIAGIVNRVQQDLNAFGITVQRVTGGAVENQEATTIFLGRSTLSNGYYHVACSIDVGNSNRTDIAFVGDEDWGSVNSTVTAMSDVVLHEAGHTYGLFHVNSGSAAETMGLRYSTPQSQWLADTGYLNQAFYLREFSGTQNGHQVMAQTFGTNSGSPGGNTGAPRGTTSNAWLLEEREFGYDHHAHSMVFNRGDEGHLPAGRQGRIAPSGISLGWTVASPFSSHEGSSLAALLFGYRNQDLTGGTRSIDRIWSDWNERFSGPRDALAESLSVSSGLPQLVSNTSARPADGGFTETTLDDEGALAFVESADL